MARASFFTLLLSLWKKKYFSANPITPSEDGRRAFLHASSAVLASSTLSACTSTLGALTGSNAQRVVVVGAGLAGLHCAYRLFEAGVDVTVYEAAQRTGGRTYSTPKGHFKGGQVAEFGGELIDSDHLVMQYFAQEFNLQLDNLPASLPANITYGYQYNIDGEFLTQEAIISLFEPIAKAVQSINMDLASIENNHGLKAMYAKRWALDRETTLVEFLRHNNASPTLMKVINFAFVGEFGLEIHELSVFNLLDLFPCDTNGACAAYYQGHQHQRAFKPFGNSDEIMRFHDGNESPARIMSQRLESQIKTEHEVIEIARSSTGYALTVVNSNLEKNTITTDYLVLALPFTTLRKIKIEDGIISAKNIHIIQQVKYGSNAKLIGQFNNRKAWQQHRHDGSLMLDQQTTDGRDIHNLWDTARGQPGQYGLWTNFVGGRAGFEIDNYTPKEQWQNMLPALEIIYQGVETAFNGLTERMIWGTYHWTLGSYMAIMPGELEISDTTPIEDDQGKIQFCGEHTSKAAQGFMEGAAESGARAALNLLIQLNIPAPKTLQDIQELRISAALKNPNTQRKLMLAELNREQALHA